MNEDISKCFGNRCVPDAPCRCLNYFGLAALSVGLALSLSATAQERANQPIAADPQLEASDPLATLNTAFRTAYADLRSKVVQKSSPVIIQSGDKMVLIKNGVRTEASAFTSRYHELKSVAHVPLALYVMLVSGADARMDTPQLNHLRAYRSLVMKGRDSLAGRGFGPDQLACQFRILDRSIALIDATLGNGLVTKAELREFTRGQKEDILRNAYEAAEDQVNTMDQQFKAWQAEMTPEERKELRAAVSSVHMARVGNIAMQYFSVALDEPFEGRFEAEEIKDSDFRLIFTESVFDESEILNAVGSHIVDADIGHSFFADRQRMHRDLLADAAEDILRKKFGRSPSAHR
ncbi:MAG: hypothetical protein KIS67_03765 [Verrucomicrobiae bacterium]|nr:hypothetical protein [Verrucomicrobiae bacterium]